jgi:hypothetical protein
VYGIVFQRTLGKAPSITAQLIGDLGMWAFLALILYVVLRVERLPLASIGLTRPTWSTIASGLLLALVVLFVLPPTSSWLVNALHLPSYERGVSQLRGLPAWALLFIALTAGTVEETLYRGYAIERLAALTGRYWLAERLPLSHSVSRTCLGGAHTPWWISCSASSQRCSISGDATCWPTSSLMSPGWQSGCSNCLRPHEDDKTTGYVS